MSCNKFFNFNLVQRDETEIIASSENAFFPASNLKDTRTTKVFRSLDGEISASIVFDFKTVEQVDSIIVIADSQRGFGFTSMTIEANITSNFDAPLFSTALTPDQAYNFGFKDLSETPQAFRFWRVTVTGSAPYVEIAKIFIGKELGLGRSISLNWSYENNDRSKYTTNRYGQIFVDKINFQKQLRFTFQNLSVDQFETLSDAFDTNGQFTPFWLILDPDEKFSTNKGRFAGVFHLADVPQFNNPFFRLYNVNVRMLEAK